MFQRNHYQKRLSNAFTTWLLATTAAIGVAGFTAQAWADETWTGGSSSDWSRDVNWDSDQVPTAADIVTIQTWTAPAGWQPLLSSAGVAASVTIKSSNSLEIGPAGSLTTSIVTVNSGAALKLDQFGALNGDLTSAGEVTVTAGGVVSGTSSVTAGVLTNAGGTVTGQTTITGTGDVENSGNLAAVNNSTTFNNLSGGLAGDVINSGTGSNSGTIASLSNSGTFTNSGTIATTASVTAGTLTNAAGGMVTGQTTITGTGDVENSGTLAAVNNAATFNNLSGGQAGDVINSGTGSNSGTIASLSNSGTFTNSGMISTSASVIRRAR